jgi:hypothetical protein
VVDIHTIYEHLTCPLCGGTMCPVEDLLRGCDQCDLKSKCDTRCTCNPSKYVTILREMSGNIRELEELRYKLMLIEKAVYANNHTTIQIRKLKHILRGGWKYARKRIL